MIDQEQTTTKQGVKYKIANPDLVPIPKNREVELFAKIKRTSKYYHQGLGQNNKPIAFKIEAIQYGSHSMAHPALAYLREKLISVF